METIDGITGKLIKGAFTKYLSEIKNGILIFGYTREKEQLVTITVLNTGNTYIGYLKTIPEAYWSPYYGTYVVGDSICACYGMSEGLYPYSFQKKYEAVQHFKLFQNKQVTIEDELFPISKYVKRTIGIEFETSLGSISEEDCFKYGLIPLRDGSITGAEYSTVILQGNSGFNLLKKQLELLRANTAFNFNCSLHIHFGNYPLNPDAIYNLYKILYYLQRDIQTYIPKYSFYTEKYKSNGKSYCKKLESFDNFYELYRFITGTDFFGSFEQPHPLDPTREHKWNVNTRYYWCNLVNLLCYNVNKTVEFRFLRPTYNLEKILTWIYILNAVLDYAESKTYYPGLDKILYSVYPDEVYNMLMKQLDKLACLQAMQTSNLDYIGSDLTLENRVFDMNKII